MWEKGWANYTRDRDIRSDPLGGREAGTLNESPDGAEVEEETGQRNSNTEQLRNMTKQGRGGTL